MTPSTVRRPERRLRPRGQIVGPLTTAGLASLVLGASAYVAGWRLGWIELLVVAAACLAAIALAIPFVIGRSRLAITRSFEPDRVSVGESVVVQLEATNTARRPSRRVEVEERIDASTMLVGVPSLRGGDSHVATYPLDTSRRARLDVGPAVVSRADPLGLLRRQVAQSDTDVCWVYPRTRLLAPLPVGFAKDLEGPTSDTSPAGDVAFHAVRPYVTGDDRRHIHWLSTAKTGSLMVRHYVDNRRPHLAILLDTDPGAYPDGQFETAVSVAASLVTSMLRQRLPVSLRLGTETVLGHTNPGDLESVLEQLTLCSTVAMSPEDLLVTTADFLRFEQGASALVVVTGDRSDTDLLPSVMYGRRHARMIIVPCVDGDAGIAAMPGARTMRVSNLDDFAAGWLGVTR